MSNGHISVKRGQVAQKKGLWGHFPTASFPDMSSGHIRGKTTLLPTQAPRKPGARLPMNIMAPMDKK